MTPPVRHRTAIIRSLLPESAQRLLDVGCGPLSAAYRYADKGEHITCVDWSLKITGVLPSNIEYRDGDFTEMNWESDSFDAIVASDVFEHVLLEKEPVFAKQCVSALKPGGRLVISVPHKGTFACLDPFQVKPTWHRTLAKLHLYNRVHNGFCDVRKGHKHYTLQELAARFAPLEVSQVVYYGYLFDPLRSWAIALTRRSDNFPGASWLNEAFRKELEKDYGERSFNIAVSFRKPHHRQSSGLESEKRSSA
jgi:2-polyprenyl-3-methyl-5-hydroxy-6-metoxy-1,4-benzoquinol methylase